MTRALQAELIKLRTTRTFAALVLSAAALSLLVVVLTTSLSDAWDANDARNLFTADFTSLFIILLGVMGMAGEWRHRTITSTILAAPDRLRLLAAKMLSYAVAGMVVSFVVTAALMLVGTLILSSRGQTTLPAGELADVMWRNLVVAAYLGAVGVCVGAIVRSQVGVIIGLLVWMLFLESALTWALGDVVQFGPLNGAPAGVINAGFVDDDASTVELLDAPSAMLVMFGWVAILFAAGGLLLRRRDLT